MNSVCVYAGSSMGHDAAYADQARNLGAEITNRDWTLVYGGSSIGLLYI